MKFLHFISRTAVCAILVFSAVRYDEFGLGFIPHALCFRIQFELHCMIETHGDTLYKNEELMNTVHFRNKKTEDLQTLQKISSCIRVEMSGSTCTPVWPNSNSTPAAPCASHVHIGVATHTRAHC